jgi:hypothetical protein
MQMSKDIHFDARHQKAVVKTKPFQPIYTLNLTEISQNGLASSWHPLFRAAAFIFIYAIT